MTNKTLIQRLRTEPLDVILTSILRSKDKLHKKEFQDTIDYIYKSWKEEKDNGHERRVLMGAYMKFCDTYRHTFNEMYHSSLQKDIRRDINDRKIITTKRKVGKVYMGEMKK